MNLFLAIVWFGGTHDRQEQSSRASSARAKAASGTTCSVRGVTTLLCHYITILFEALVFLARQGQGGKEGMRRGQGGKEQWGREGRSRRKGGQKRRVGAGGK